MGVNRDFWRGRRVFLTGQTGFKGAWLCLWLESLGASVSAMGLEPESEPSLHALLSPWQGQDQRIGDMRDVNRLAIAMAASAPEIVIHMAAQALVRRSYADPAGTFSHNVMGTVSLLEAVRRTPSVGTVLIVTSDKVYANDGSGRAFGEGDPLGGADPYSASKACTELVAKSYYHSFLKDSGVALATVRAGNVIGGGDWAQDRLVPSFVRALHRGEPVRLRYPHAVRPWQHVLEPLGGYLRFAEALTDRGQDGLPDALNFGPDAGDFATVSDLAEELAHAFGREPDWEQAPGEWQPEASVLTLSSALAGEVLDWRPSLDRTRTVAWTADWYKAHRDGADMRAFSRDQIAAYEGLGA